MPLRLTAAEYARLTGLKSAGLVETRQQKRGSMRGCKAGGLTVCIRENEQLDEAAMRASWRELGRKLCE